MSPWHALWIAPVVFVVLTGCVLLWFSVGSANSERQPSYDVLIAQPDFSWVQQFTGKAVPAEFHHLHSSGEVIQLQNVIIGDEFPASFYAYIDLWIPQNRDGYDFYTLSPENVLYLAGDGSGGSYYSKGNEDYQNVYYQPPDSDVVESLNVSVTRFIQAAREAKAAEA